MSVNVALPPFKQASEFTMYAAGLVQTTRTSPFSFASPKHSPRLSRAASPHTSRFRTQVSSPSPCREKSLVNNNTTKVLGCAKCHENQMNNMVNSMAKLSVVEKCSKDMKLKEKILDVVLEPTGISASELSTKIGENTTQTPLIIDCRSFIAYNLCHIKGAMNIGCTDQMTKRRLQSGKITLCQAIKCALAKEKYLAHTGSDVIVYDDNSTEISQQKECGIRLVASSLLREGKTVHFLKGGLVEFHSRYEELCEEPKAPVNVPLYSPTTPAIVSDDIDTAIASRILPFLYIGNERDAANRERLQELKITHVLNCTSHIPLYFEKEGITYRRLPASDSGRQNLKQYFLEACKFIDDTRKSGGRVLVHCQAGVSRSATITMAYIMKHSKMTMHDIFKVVKSRRSIIAPNFNFMGQLMEFEQALNDGNIERDSDLTSDIQSL